MLTQNYLKEWIRYEPETGEFHWLPRPRSKRINSLAGCIGNHGYRVIGFKGKLYLAHRLAYFYMTGLWPEYQIDHKDRNRSNNQWSNLRQATSGQNSVNRKAAGVCPRTRKGRSGIWFSAYIEKDGKKYGNTFRTEEKAKEWRITKERELFGDFAREIV